MKIEQDRYDLNTMSKEELRAEICNLKHINEELTKHVNVDGLTGVFNYRYLQEYLNRELSKFKRHRFPLSLIMCDIDYFKAFNDSFGHQTGDSILRHFSQILKKNIREYDILARYGGEEFAIVLSETSMDDAFIVAEKLRKLVDQSAFKENDQTFHITASFGVAALMPDDTSDVSVKALIYNADMAMLTAKAKGRNCSEKFRSKRALQSTSEESADFPHYAPERLMPVKRSTIWMVDDEEASLETLSRLLAEDYDLLSAKNGDELFALLERAQRPDLILLDVVMPGMSGLEVCRLLKENPRYVDIPIIFLSSKDGMEDEIKGFSFGIFDYVTKPICPPTFRMRVKNCLRLEYQKRQLDQLIEEQSTYLYDWQSAAIECISAVIDYRDNGTGSHIERCGSLMRTMATAASELPKFSNVLTEPVIDLMSKAAPFHDIGKLGIPDRILLKPGRLTVEEFEVMKKHTTMGFGVVKVATSETKTSPFLQYVGEIAYSHHERWDGSGYPQGLSGTEIPVAARIMAIIDVYDAITSERCYKEANSHQEAMNYIISESGKHFDPDLVGVLERIQDQIIHASDD